MPPLAIVLHQRRRPARIHGVHWVLGAIVFIAASWPVASHAAPVLAVAGGRDLIHPPVTVRQTAARLSGETLVFDEMSHWLIGEPGWEKVADRSLEWLETV